MKTIAKVCSVTIIALICLALFAKYWFLSGDNISPPKLPGITENGTVLHQGHERQWLSYVPASQTDKPQLLLFFRGSGADGAMARSGTYYRFDLLAEQHGFIVVYPTGFEKNWNGCRKAASTSANLQQIDDVGFVRKLITEMSTRYGIDEQGVFVAGMSNGGHMVYRLAYEAPELVTGAAAIMANLPTDANSECKPEAQPVPMMILTGTADPINPYNGGEVTVYGESRGTVKSAFNSARYWAELNDHSGKGNNKVWPKSQSADETSVESLHWAEPDKFPVTLLTVHGGGHTFPNLLYSAPRILGTTSHELDAAEVIWAFFSEL